MAVPERVVNRLIGFSPVFGTIAKLPNIKYKADEAKLQYINMRIAKRLLESILLHL